MARKKVNPYKDKLIFKKTANRSTKRRGLMRGGRVE